MSEENKYKRATDLLMEGKRKEASTILLTLYKQTTKRGFKVQLIDALLVALDPIKDNQKLIDMSSEGIKLASELRMSAPRAHFMGRKADFLMSRVSSYRYQRSNLKLTPGWIGFSTEADKRSYEELTAEIEGFEKEVDQLLTEAIFIAERIDNKRALGFILMSKASAENYRYLYYKMEYMSGTLKVKVWLLLHRYGFEVPILFGLKYHKTLKEYLDSFTASYLRAAKLLDEIGDDTAGFAYYDLAVNLKTAYKFRRTNKYLCRAKVIAERSNNTLLDSKIKELEKSIKARNKDIPNYLEGETRENRTK